MTDTIHPAPTLSARIQSQIDAVAQAATLAERARIVEFIRGKAARYRQLRDRPGSHAPYNVVRVQADAWEYLANVIERGDWQ